MNRKPIALVEVYGWTTHDAGFMLGAFDIVTKSESHDDFPMPAPPPPPPLLQGVLINLSRNILLSFRNVIFGHNLLNKVQLPTYYTRRKMHDHGGNHGGMLTRCLDALANALQSEYGSSI